VVLTKSLSRSERGVKQYYNHFRLKIIIGTHTQTKMAVKSAVISIKRIFQIFCVNFENGFDLEANYSENTFFI
jgi:hypothetical protein